VSKVILFTIIAGVKFPSFILKKMKTINSVLIILLLLLSVAHIEAQKDSANEKLPNFKHAIGAGAGFTTGYGLSYRFMPAKFGGQINFAPFQNDQTTRYSIGLTFLYKLIQSTNTNLYLYQGNHFYYNSQLQYIYVEPKDPNLPMPEPTMERVTESFFNNGIGIGIEFIIIKRIALNLMGGYATYRNFSQINFTGEAALYYKF